MRLASQILHFTARTTNQVQLRGDDCGPRESKRVKVRTTTRLSQVDAYESEEVVGGKHSYSAANNMSMRHPRAAGAFQLRQQAKSKTCFHITQSTATEFKAVVSSKRSFCLGAYYPNGRVSLDCFTAAIISGTTQRNTTYSCGVHPRVPALSRGYSTYTPNAAGHIQNSPLTLPILAVHPSLEQKL